MPTTRPVYAMPIKLSLTQECYNQLRAFAKERGCTMSEAALLWIRAGIKRSYPQPPRKRS
jgi:hypothetical protein